MCFGGGAPKAPKMPPPMAPAPSPAPNPPPPPAAPPPELVNADADAPKVTAQKTPRQQAQQGARGTSQLTIKQNSVNTGGGGGKSAPSGSLNIPT